MKTQKILSVLAAVTLVLGLSTSVFAQRGQGMQGQGQGMMNGQGQGRMMNQNMQKGATCAYLNLTADQQAQVTNLRTALMQQNLPLRNQLGEMRAKMQTLQTGDKQDLKAINKLIDDMSSVRAQIMKNAAAHRVAVRNILTDEQKVLFDARASKGFGGQKGMRASRGAKRGMRGNGAGNGYGPNYGPGCPGYQAPAQK